MSSNSFTRFTERTNEKNESKRFYEQNKALSHGCAPPRATLRSQFFFVHMKAKRKKNVYVSLMVSAIRYAIWMDRLSLFYTFYIFSHLHITHPSQRHQLIALPYISQLYAKFQTNPVANITFMHILYASSLSIVCVCLCVCAFICTDDSTWSNGMLFFIPLLFPIVHLFDISTVASAAVEFLFLCTHRVFEEEIPFQTCCCRCF